MICIFINVNPGLEQISDPYPMCTIAGIDHPCTGFPRAAKGVVAWAFDAISGLFWQTDAFRFLWGPALISIGSSGQG